MRLILGDSSNIFKKKSKSEPISPIFLMGEGKEFVGMVQTLNENILGAVAPFPVPALHYRHR
jgi:hypothetical protein